MSNNYYRRGLGGNYKYETAQVVSGSDFNLKANGAYFVHINLGSVAPSSVREIHIASENTNALPYTYVRYNNILTAILRPTENVKTTIYIQSAGTTSLSLTNDTRYDYYTLVCIK